ncbi:MAG: formate C-acetyltransferase/glycerol dehydratase family glycyl radical enzyme, partial [Tissierellales bacterium]|nr:formate C-acetyltransferase/glycerol dehydratase family glycyl radical enzyme [Tissierellales bacterium]
TEPKLSLERAEIETEVYQKYAGVKEIPVLRALVFEEFMKRRELYIGEGELIVGEKGFEPQTAPTFPELCCHTLEDFDVMEQRDTITFKVADKDRKIHEEKIMPYWENRSTRQKLLDSMSKEWKDCYEAGIFTEFMEQRAPGHTVADDKIYKKGFKDIKKEVETAIENLDFINDKEAYKKKSELEGMKIACDAIITYGKRYAEKAERLAAEETDPQKKEDLLSIAENCKVVPENKPETFSQAVQMYWFVHIGVTTELNTWDAFSPGRLDQYLYPFYRKEIEAGTLTKEKAKEILECLWVKFNNQPAPPKVGVTMLESATYTDFANINTGGINPETGEDGVNDVSYLILDVMDEMKLLQPSSNVQVSIKNPKEFIKRACEVSREGWGQPAFYNTEELIEELLQAGKDIKDARYGGSSGCVETGAQGREAYPLTGYFNTPKIFELTLNNGFDKRTGKQLGLKTGDPRDFETYEELFDAYKKQLKHFIDIKIEGNNKIERIFAEHMPSPEKGLEIKGLDTVGKDVTVFHSGTKKINGKYYTDGGRVLAVTALAENLEKAREKVYNNIIGIKFYNMQYRKDIAKL